MNHGKVPPAEPNPERLSLESLEQQLRALPPPTVPDALQAKLIAAIPSAKAVGSLSARRVRRWWWIAGAGVACIASSAAVYLCLNHSLPPPDESGRGARSTVAAPQGADAPAASKAMRDYEARVRFDPYDADAWFGLAKAQAGVNRPEDAISSAQKAIDIARARGRADFVSAVEAWVRPYRAAQSAKPAR